VLKILSGNQVLIKEEKYIPLSQQEIADLAHCSKLKINKLLYELIKMEFIVMYKYKRGKYALTDKANKFLKLTMDIEQ
jgi:predicted transcriptional regulator